MKKTLLSNILFFIHSFFTSKKKSKQSLSKVTILALLVGFNFGVTYSQCTTRGGGVNRSGLNQICINTSTGTMTLGNGYLGSILNWQKRLNNSTTWTDIANTTNTYSEVPSSAGTWQYRAYVNNDCSPQYSTSYELIVKPEVVITPAAVAEADQFLSTAILSYTGNNSDQYYLKFDAAAVAAGMGSNVQSGNISGSTGNINIQIPPCSATGTYNATLYVDTNTPKCTSITYNIAVFVKPNVAQGGTINSDQTICNNTAPNDLVLDGGGMYNIIKWQSSTDPSFINPRDYTPSSANPRKLTSSQIGPLTENTYFRVIGTANGCDKTSSNVILISINAGPPATFSPNPPLTVCVNTNVSYTTQSGKSNYIWDIPGTSTVDYEIQSGGIGTSSNSVTLIWLTPGNKTATVKYSNGCSLAANATSTILVTKTDRGRTKGGIHICQGSQNPTLSVYNFDDPNKDEPYSDLSKIIRWEYSDDNNKTWTTIANTVGMTIYTPTEILTASRNYRAVAKNGNCDEQYAIETRIDVEFAPTINSQSTATQTQCINGTFNPISVSATGYEIQGYQWFSNTSATTTNATSLENTNGATTNTYIPQSTTAGTLYYYCIVTGKCGSTTSAFSEAIITKAASTPPRAGNITQPNCNTPTGSVVLEGVPNSGKLIESRGTSYNYTTSGTTFEISGLVPGTYKFAIDDNCTAVYSSDIIIKPVNTNIWNGIKWSDETPDVNQRIEFTGNYDIDTDVSGCSCTIENGANVTIRTGRTLTITNAITVLEGGTLSFKNNSSLMQSNNDPTINSGDVSYERISTPIFQRDYIYWSSPVKNQKLADLSPETAPAFFFFNDGTDWAPINRENTMDIGKGYIIRGPETYTNSTKQQFSAIFKGVPNNGNLESEVLSKGKYYLIGNPYPSALSADALISQNSTLLNGTMYFWTHNTPIDLSLADQYTTDDYATYNLSGGVSAKSDKNRNASSETDNGIKPTGKIAAGQSFFVSARMAGKVQFNNSMRSGGTNNNQFFKSDNTSKEAVLEKNRVWLNMTNDKGAFKQLLVGYIEGATNSYENKYDGISFDGNIYLDFYSVNNGNKFVIQGRAIPFEDSDIVPLGYRTAVEGDFTISIDEVDGKMSNQAIYIEDKVTGEIHDLRTSNYTFKTKTGTFTDRLILRYTNKTLGTGDFENLENGILVSVKNKTINVLSSKENIKEVSIYDITGKLLYNKKKVSNTELQIQNLPSSNQVLLVKVTLENEFTTTQKIIFQ